MKLNENDYPTVRRLKLKDRKKVSGLIKKFAERSGNEGLMQMVPGTPKPESEEADGSPAEKIYELMRNVMGSLIDWVEEDVTAWFMELTGIETREEWDDLPFDIEVYILEELYKQTGFNNFFSKALGLYNKIQG